MKIDPWTLRSASPPTTRVLLLTRLGHKHDDEAWRQFYELYAPLILSYCRRNGLQHADAWDVAQAVFTNISRWIGSFRYDRRRGQFRNWLGVVTRREIQRIRERDARQTVASGGAAQSFLEELQAASDPTWSEAFNAHVFRVSLDRLRPKFDPLTWEAFTRTWLRDEPISRVADSLDKNAAWVYRARHRVIRRLEAEVTRLTDDGQGVID